MANVDKAGRLPFLGDEDLKEIKRRLEDGESRASIGRSMGRSLGGFYRFIERNFPDYQAPDASWEATLTLPDDPAVPAYIAGLIDGEGSVLKISYGKGRVGYGWQVKVQMTDQAVIAWLGSFGGKTDDYKPRQETWKHVYAWNVSRRRDVLYLLERIAPYMIVKRDRALEAIADIKSSASQSKE